MPPRVALDANVLIAGIGWPRWPYEILLHAIHRDFILVLSPIVIAEARHRITVSFPDLAERFESLLAALDYILAPVPTPDEVAAHRGLVRQEKDVPVALSIIDAQVDYFVTYDRDFTDVDETTERVRQALPGIILPPVFLREVMGWTSQELEQIRRREWSDLEES